MSCDRSFGASRRALLGGATLAALAPGAARAMPAAAQPAGQRLRLAAAWRDAITGRDYVGVIAIDWAAGTVRIDAAVAVPTRAHGLLAWPAALGGGFVAVAQRPGRWLLRVSAGGGVERWHRLDDERPLTTLNGHVEASADGQWLFTTETDPATQGGWIGVRDARSFERIAVLPSGGRDPHQLLRAPDGTLLVANGGLLRDAEGRPLARERMAPSLVQVDPEAALLGRWTLADPRLSLRHLAWSHAFDGTTRQLGVALQAEHDDAAARREAPVLALWDGRSLTLPTHDAQGEGYAGDIAAGPGGGFVLSAQKARRALWWRPADRDRLHTVAELTEPCALQPSDDGRGVLLAAARGAARWHAQREPRLLPWPAALAPDNHWVRLHDPPGVG